MKEDLVFKENGIIFLKSTVDTLLSIICLLN